MFTIMHTVANGAAVYEANWWITQAESAGRTAAAYLRKPV